MHALCIVFLNAEAATEKLVAEAMGPHAEGEDCIGMFDWYTIGGRYDGMMLGLEQPEGTDFWRQYHAEARTLERNSCRARDIVDSACHDFVKADGEWVSREKWDGNTFAPSCDDFEGELARYIAAHPDLIAVCVDRHS